MTTSSFLSEDPTFPDISTTVPTTRATTSWRDILPSSTTRHLHLLRALLLAAAAFASALLTLLGFWLILWLLVTRSFAPPSATHTRRLDFDIVDNALLGIAHFTPPSSLPYKSPLYPGQTAEIVIQLHIPSTSSKGGLVQVVTELLPPSPPPPPTSHSSSSSSSSSH
jgi:type IV secretory pathway TrbD component